ncbi:hypothetical protein EYV94_18755 [Puteibacter caeruleilacunae]|nr:hypothetical protein EYV94_18755 [Puteibacter caeruleilacunae]
MKINLMNHSSSKLRIPISSYGDLNLIIDSARESWCELFEMAVRKNNQKRNFLFVSKLLAKHIPIQPSVLFEACGSLVEQFNQGRKLQVNKDGRLICTNKTLVIGFAETATAMGHAVFDYFEGDVNYVHTTRDSVKDARFAFEFKEEHSHATEQLFFLQDETWLKDAEEILIVDDEVTTGKTIRNIIDEIEHYYPGKSYHIFTFLDWRNGENTSAYKQYCKDQDVQINFYSLIRGEIGAINIRSNMVGGHNESDTNEYNAKANGWQFHNCQLPNDTALTAKNGINSQERGQMQKAVNKIVAILKPHLRGDKRSVIGTGEFMYVPMKCAENLSGSNFCNATTRSPIIPNNEELYGIKKSLSFNAPYDANRVEYLYNINTQDCDEVVLFFEHTLVPNQIAGLLQALDKCAYSYKHVVFCKS